MGEPMEALELEWEEALEIADGASASATSVFAPVRGGGTGGNAWIARLLPGITNDFEREFLRPDRSGLSRSGRSGTIEWSIPGDGVYEFRNICHTARHTVDGIFIVNTGRVAWSSREDALRVLGSATPAFNDANLPALAGTPKQVEWALRIRAQILGGWSERSQAFVDSWQSRREWDRAILLTMASEARQLVEQWSTARQWIDARNEPLEAFFPNGVSIRYRELVNELAA